MHTGIPKWKLHQRGTLFWSEHGGEYSRASQQRCGEYPDPTISLVLELRLPNNCMHIPKSVQNKNDIAMEIILLQLDKKGLQLDKKSQVFMWRISNTFFF